MAGPDSRRRNGVRNFFLIVIAILGVVAFLRWQLAPQARLNAAPDAPGIVRHGSIVTIPPGSPYRSQVTVQTVTTRETDETRVAPAIVEAEPSRVFNVLPPLGGRVVRLLARPGDQVTQGQPLVEIDSGDLAQANSDVDKAEAQETLTRKALVRAKGDYQAGGMAVKDYQSAANDEAQAESELQRARERLKILEDGLQVQNKHIFTVAAPASGTVTALSIAPGSYINDPTQTMLTVTNIDTVWVTASVAEQDAGFIAKGQPVDIQFLAYPHVTCRGTVSFVNDLLEPDTRRLKVRVTLDNRDHRFKPNMFAQMTFQAPPARDVIVPDSALQMNNDNTTVFIETTPWSFEQRPVQLGSDQNGYSVITSGLKAGERIVTVGGVSLND